MHRSPPDNPEPIRAPDGGEWIIAVPGWIWVPVATPAGRRFTWHWLHADLPPTEQHPPTSAQVYPGRPPPHGKGPHLRLVKGGSDHESP